ncbi:MAG: histidine--tRNA ligase [Bacteroidota bacterium]
MKPSISKGTRDFSPIEIMRRNFIFKTIREVFERYGYQPIETPAMEKLSTLEGKYGEEGDKLLFRILNSGPIIDEIQNLKSEIKISDITEKGLRYDLTVPFARYVVQHQNEIIFPFKRYQIQPVWRADRPQKGRYCEFFQCDADVIGSDSLLNEVELVQIIIDVFVKLNIPYKIKINNRKILFGIAEIIDEKEKIIDITVAIDKLEKIGVDEVNKELKEKGISDKAIEHLQAIINFKGNYSEKITILKKIFSSSEIGKKGIEEMEFIFSSIAHCQLPIAHCKLDITLARGLNYYTGTIFEVVTNNFPGSLCGGGRYDNLTGIFGLPNVSGVGISFGIDRIFDVMNELNLFDSIGLTASITKVMFVNFGEVEEKFCLPLLTKVRAAGINAEIYPDHTKLKKQFDYANKKQIPFVVVIGGNEIKTGELILKNMNSGEQSKIKINELISILLQ